MYKILLIKDIDKFEHIDSSIIDRILTRQIDKYESHNHLNLISFDWYNVKDINLYPMQVIIYFTPTNLFFICENDLCVNQIKKIIKEEPTNERILYEFFLELIKYDIDYLEKLEEKIAEIEEDSLIRPRHGYARKIISFKRELLRLKRYYEQLNYIFEGLTENENGAISKESLKYYNILNNRIDRLFATVINLRDYVAQVREAYQAQIDIEQNNLMKVFTVVTAIFLPLTLIVGWYGMNLKMPEYSWNLGYPFVIILSVIVAIFCIWLFRHKRWM